MGPLDATPCKVLMIASEAVPVAKTGGLADVVGTLPNYLKKKGYDVRVVLPYYRAIHESGALCQRLVEQLPVDGPEGSLAAELLSTSLEGDVPCYLVRRDEYFDRSRLYGTARGDYFDNDARFIYFARAVFALCRALPFYPDVFHAHDWQAALVPAYQRHVYGADTAFRRTRSLLTIHNLAYQGVFPGERFKKTGLPDSFFSMEGMEFWGNMNFLKAGIAASHILSTVSPTYCREILSAEFGCGLEQTLSARAGDLYGILNGVDYEEWNPETDPHIPAVFDVDHLEGKDACKRTLLKEMGISKGMEKAPLFGMISRLTSQKGLDLILAASEEMAKLGIACVILGEGEEQYRVGCERLMKDVPGRFSVRFGFDIPLAHRIHAGCDYLLMPSRYEPCGLNQIHAMRYGTVPVVRATGGLKDTVEAFDARTGEGTGFLFDTYASTSFLDALKEAVRVYGSGTENLTRLRRNCMKQRYSWDRSASAYGNLYDELRSRS